VNLYVDGPGASGHFSDSFSSQIGTPAIIVPNLFTIEGLGKGGTGYSGSNSNTVIGICTGPGAPLSSGTPNGCTTAFPLRSFTITLEAFFDSPSHQGSSSNASTCTPDYTGSPRLPFCYLFVTVSGGPFVIGGNGTDVASENVYISTSGTTDGTGEAVAIVNLASQTTVASNAGMYQTNTVCQNPFTSYGDATWGCTSNSQIAVVVPSGATVGTTLGSLVFGTPIMGLAPTKNNSYTAEINETNKTGFGQKIKNVTIDASSYQGAIAVQNVFGQEFGGLETVSVSHHSFIGYDEYTTDAQNFGPIAGTFQALTDGNTNHTCGPQTTGIFLHNQTGGRAIEGFTINSSTTNCGPTTAQPKCAVMLDNVERMISNGHTEGYAQSVCIGLNNPTANVVVQNISGGPSGNAATSVVLVSNMNSNRDFILQGIRKQGATNTINDQINGNAITDSYTELYAFDCLTAREPPVR
jgi:hypothetical protein